jgi:hypothetical protein
MSGGHPAPAAHTEPAWSRAVAIIVLDVLARFSVN